MPARHRIKDYVPNSYYHIYNRGVEKRRIFRSDKDYGVLLGYLKEYLSKKDINSLQEIVANPKTSYIDKGKALTALRLNNFHKKIYLNAYVLKSNHFHFLIRQEEATDINIFMKSLFTRFTMYINSKYKRVGPLFQGVYKAVLVSTDEQLLQLTKYLHRQSFYTKNNKVISNPSSYPEYLGKRKTDWVYQDEILDYFSRTSRHKSYRAFVEESEDLSGIAKLILEN